ncbi:MAG: squalene/phytoene synthase family protein [Deltaproteobacteria bacterium]|nr:squalene/phytoene synthase family protein [Deltaproteobacteria bacterium]
MTNTNLKKILKGVSRSFYLSLVLLPRKIRFQMGIAFLCCKAADTIADTELIPRGERLRLLNAYREWFAAPQENISENIFAEVVQPGGGSPAELNLLRNLPALMSALESLEPHDWLLIQELVLELTQGMIIDLEFSAFETELQLNDYTYYVAGCVGRFWTKIIQEHFSFAKHFGEEHFETGEKLGKGLQLVNILRDLPQDLKKGRSYIPKGMPLPKIFSLARQYLQEYQKYCSYFPWYALRLKAVVRLPARLGFKTLELLESSKTWPKADLVVKVSRRQVYGALLESFFK